jgi:hypothetical protein
MVRKRAAIKTRLPVLLLSQVMMIRAATVKSDHHTMKIRDRGNSPGAGIGLRRSVLVLAIITDVLVAVGIRQRAVEKRNPDYMKRSLGCERAFWFWESAVTLREL